MLTAHNFYRQAGGEDVVFEAETALLRAAGHDVTTWSVSNDAIAAGAGWRVARDAVWNPTSYADVQRVVRENGIEVAHFHNTFPLLSPAVFHAARRAGAAVVLSLHNPRLMCPSATFFRDGRPCMDCLGKPLAWPGIVHACYHRSRSQTAVGAIVTAVHRFLGTWRHAVDRYIVFTDYYRDLVLRAGLPATKVVVKPHFVDVGLLPPVERSGNYALFVGRLDPVKGIGTLVEAFERLHAHRPEIALPLYVCGDGPLEQILRDSIAAGRMRARLLGRLPQSAVYSLMAGARCLVWPSEGSFETFGLVAVEAMACGTPVVASDGGVAPHVVPRDRGGRHFRSGDAEDLARHLVEIAELPDADLARLRVSARQVFEERYRSQTNLGMLEEVYRQAVLERGKAGRPRSRSV